MSVYPIVIFEGPDRVGKTTIANKVAKLLNTEVFMTNSKECFNDRSIFTRNSSNIAKFNLYLAMYIRDLELSSQLKKPIVIYRSFLSEMVYSELLHRRTNEVANKYVDTIFNQLNATIILCNNREKTNFDDKDLNDHQVQASSILYDKLKKDVATDIFELETSVFQPEQQAKCVIDYITQKGENNENRNSQVRV